MDPYCGVILVTLQSRKIGKLFQNISSRFDPIHFPILSIVFNQISRLLVLNMAIVVKNIDFTLNILYYGLNIPQKIYKTSIPNFEYLFFLSPIYYTSYKLFRTSKIVIKCVLLFKSRFKITIFQSEPKCTFYRISLLASVYSGIGRLIYKI